MAPGTKRAADGRGRRDAAAVARRFGLSQREITRIVRLSRGTGITEDGALRALSHAWSILQKIFLDDETIRTWLTKPIRRLRGQSPLWLLQEHGADAFEGLAEEMRDGAYD